MDEEYRKVQENKELGAHTTNSTETDDDVMYAKAIRYCKEYDVVGISQLQRHLRAGFNQTIRYLQRMEDDGMLICRDDRGSRWHVVKE